MAEKSAHIDATLRIAGLSEIFTQDLEDMLKDKQDIQRGVNNINQNERPNPPEKDSGNSAQNSAGQQTDAQSHGNNHADEDIVATEGEFDLLNQTLDFNLLVSPFTTVDTIVNKIPVIREIFQGALIAIPLKVKGDVSNPKVTLLSPSDIGSRSLGILKRTLKAPVKIIDSLVTNKSNPKKTDNQEQ